LGPDQINTDDEGRFELVNLPSDGDLLVYGIMKAMKNGGALPVKKFKPTSGAATDLGNLSTVPAHTLRGRIVLADGKPIPPQTRVMFSREEAWGSNFVAAAADGSFAIGGIPPEVIDVIVRVNGYRLSPKNKSFEPLNGSSIKGLMSGDIEDLVILYEPGETIRPDRDWQAAAEKGKRLRTQRLAGVTAALEEFPREKVAATAPVKRASRPLPKIAVPTKEPAPAPREKGVRWLKQKSRWWFGCKEGTRKEKGGGTTGTFIFSVKEKASRLMGIAWWASPMTLRTAWEFAVLAKDLLRALPRLRA
jgi:hypothetical protein